MAKRGQGTSWTPIYMMVVVIIAIVLVMTLIKPAFRLASQQAAASESEAASVAKGALFGLTLLWNRR